MPVAIPSVRHKSTMYKSPIHTPYVLQMMMNALRELTTVTQMLCAVTSQATLHVHAILASQEMEPVV